MRTQSRGAAATVSGVVAAVVLLAGCTGSDADAEAAPSTTATNTTATSAPTTSATADAPDVPEMPAEATGSDDAAAVAFVEYWVELLNHGLSTGDTAAVRAVTDLSTCDVCASLFEATEDTGGPDATGDWSLTTMITRAPAPEDPTAADKIVQAEVLIEGSTPSPFGTLSAGLVSTSGGWELAWLLTYQY